jgi:hypothetical protein
MVLTLELASPHDDPPGAERRKVFDARGGTLGRLPDNDWVLPDGYVSSHHARIHFTGSAFQIEDTSTNGIFINSLDQRLPRGQVYTLRSGDRLFIDPYEITVTISSGAPVVAAPPAGLIDDPFGPSEPPPLVAPYGSTPVVPWIRLRRPRPIRLACSASGRDPRHPLRCREPPIWRGGLY